jgi:hypothetical protein
MKKRKHQRETGACACCVVPFIILLLAFVAAVIVTSAVWHAAVPPFSGWAPAHHHHFDAYRAGFQEGNRIGEQYATRGQAEPAADELTELATREAQRQHITNNRQEWMKGFRDGFTHAFQTFNKEAGYFFVRREWQA